MGGGETGGSHGRAKMAGDYVPIRNWRCPGFERQFIEKLLTIHKYFIVLLH